MTSPRAPVHVRSLRSIDTDHLNAQHVTTREILCRLPKDSFRLTAFTRGRPDPRLAGAAHVRLVSLPARRQSLFMLRSLWGDPPDVLLHPNPDRYDGRIERPLLWLRHRVKLAVHLVIVIDPERIDRRSMAHLRRQARRADLLTANSPAVADSAARAFGRRPVVVLGGIDATVFRPAETSPSEPVVAVVGSFQARKRYDLTIRAAERNPGVSFWCAGAGPGPLRAWIESEIRDRGLPNVAILDAMPQPALAVRLAQSTVLFHPSEHEGAPQVLLQAQACGCVPIARSTYSPPTLHDGVDGLTAPDDEGLLAALDRALSDAPLRARLRAGCLQESRSHSWERVAQVWAELLTAAVSR